MIYKVPKSQKESGARFTNIVVRHVVRHVIKLPQLII